jgi:cell division protein FtsI/penicillin-binding protein 2
MGHFARLFRKKGQSVAPQVNRAGHGGAASSSNRQHSWFIGPALADQPKYAIAVLLEDAAQATDAKDIGRGVLERFPS